jgi:hypothetical protein
MEPNGQLYTLGKKFLALIAYEGRWAGLRVSWDIFGEEKKNILFPCSLSYTFSINPVKYSAVV